MILRLKVPCTILASSPTASKSFAGYSHRFHADAVDPIEYKCLRCGLTWDDSPLRDYRQVTCSNCYSERINITLLRLGFENWGEQNGGEEEQRRRFDEATTRMIR